MQSVPSPLKIFYYYYNLLFLPLKANPYSGEYSNYDVDCREKLDSFGRENYFPAVSRDALMSFKLPREIRSRDEEREGGKKGSWRVDAKFFRPSRLLNSEGRVSCLFNTESLIGRPRLGSR